MKILHISKEGDGIDMAIDAMRLGHEVKVYILAQKYRNEIGEGLVDKIDDWKKWVDWCDFAQFDTNGLSDIHKDIVKKKPCFCGSAEGEKMEKDRAFAHSLMAQVGMKRFESKSFKTLKEAQAHLKEHKVKHVCKIFGGQAESFDVTLSEMESGEDAIAIMERYAESGKRYDGVEVEERIEGIEVGCAGFFNGKDWVGPIELNWQFKHPFNGRPGSIYGLGPLCGESGTLIKYTDQNNEFFKKTLNLFKDYLQKINYRGEIDIGTITNESGIYPIEFTPRRGYPDLYIRRSLSISSQTDLFYAIAKGESMDFKSKTEWGLGVVLLAPGFPYEESARKQSVGYPIFGYDQNNPELHLMGAKKGKKGGIEVADFNGYAAVVASSGPTIESAQRRAYWNLNAANPKRLYIPNGFYRTDIGDRVLLQKDELLELKVISEAEWGS